MKNTVVKKTAVPKPRSKPTKPAKQTMAQKADKFQLYEQSVQAPDLEVAFVEKTFAKLRQRRPIRLREDFSGTACFAAEWVKKKPDHVAEARDLEQKVLDFATAKHVPPLGDAARRLTLKREDVRVPSQTPFDVVVAYNYSYMIFKTRLALRAYFESVRQSLVKDGVLFMDLLGGPLAQQVSLEPRKVGRHTTYVWEQELFDPITNDFKAHIHFRFADGSALDRAFTYEWRLWSIVELRELLAEAGFTKSHVYWEVDADKNQYKILEHVENDPSWNIYLVALA